MLGVVVLIAFSLVFPTVQAWLGQRADLEALAAEVAEAEQTERDLRSELDRWGDPAYVQAQARERLSYVMPGETSYRVIDPEVVVEPEPELEDGPVAGPAVPSGAGVAPWYATVWDSVQVAGAPDVAGTQAAGADGDTGTGDGTAAGAGAGGRP